MVSLNGVTFGYGRKVLFDSMDMTLNPGGLYGLLGLNGAGKTSLLKLMAGALLPQAGQVEVFGQRPGARRPEHLADLAFVAEDPWVPALTGAQWVDRMKPFRPAFEADTFRSLTDLFEVDAKQLLTKLSYGQKKKLVLAAALAGGSRTILLDEPTNGLDIPSKVRFRSALAQASRPDRIIVVSTHQIRDLESLLDPILIMDQGKIPFTLDPATLGDRLSTVRLNSLAGRDVVHAVRDTLGWAAVLAEPADTPPDLELVFSAAVTQAARLKAALAGEPLTPFEEGALG